MKKHYNLDPKQIMFDAKRFLQSRYHTDPQNAKDFQLHDAVAQAVNLAIAPRWMEDEQELLTQRRACYISAEWLMGRLWHNNLFCLGIYDQMEELLSAQGAHLSDMEDIEDAALGNGGLGRLAACYLDAAATHGTPLTGYGLYYRFGLFKQSFIDGRQVESPDDWTNHGDPWSMRREDEAVQVDFAEFSVKAVPYDMPVIGLEGCVRTLRLWKAEPINPIDMPAFNDQDYTQASADAVRAADFTTLLYPGDSKRAGKTLRLRQQYLLCSATMQDLLRHCPDRRDFAKTYAVQLNDTHPVMAIPEFIRLMLKEGMRFDDAAQLAFDTFSFTIPFFNATITLKYLVMSFLYFFCGFGTTAFYMSFMICIANTTEYNEYKFGKRSEGVIFSTRAFLTKLGMAINTLVVMLFYIVIGVNHETNAIADLEQQANIGAISGEQKMSEIGNILAGIAPGKTYALLALVALCTVGTYTVAYFIYKKKYFIDEAYFDKMSAALAQREAESAGESE